VIVAYIDAHRDRFGVEPICAVLSEHGVTIAPSTYYARLQQRVTDTELEEAYLVNALVDLHQANWGVYGIRKLWHAARRAGHQVGRDQVGRLMGIAGISGAVRGRHHTVTTRSDRSAPRHPDLVKRGWDTPTGPDQLWVADFCYVWTLAGFCYVAFVVDAFSRRILGWRVSTSRETSLVLDPFRQALQVRHRSDAHWTGTRLVHHSDAGSQGGIKRWTQHLDCGGVDGQASGVDDGVNGQGADEVAGEAVASTRRGAVVLARDRQGGYQRGGGARGRRVASGWHPLVPRAWRHADVHACTGLGPVPVLPGARRDRHAACPGPRSEGDRPPAEA
jgi:putative transposase